MGDWDRRRNAFGLLAIPAALHLVDIEHQLRPLGHGAPHYDALTHQGSPKQSDCERNCR